MEEEYKKYIEEDLKGKCKLCMRELGYTPKDENKNYICRKCYEEEKADYEKMWD